MLAVSQETLFSPADLGETSLVPDLFGPTYAAFIDPYLNQLEANGQHPITTVVWALARPASPGKAKRRFPESTPPLHPGRRPIRHRDHSQCGRPRRRS